MAKPEAPKGRDRGKKARRLPPSPNTFNYQWEGRPLRVKNLGKVKSHPYKIVAPPVSQL